MGLINDIKLFRKFQKYAKAANAEPKVNPIVTLYGYEKNYGTPPPLDFDNYVENFRSWAFNCGYRNALGVAKVPLKIYKRSVVDNKEVLDQITAHPFLDLMQSVNPHFNKFELMVLTELNLEVCGNAYWWIVRDGLRVPRQVWNIPANWMKIVPSQTEFVAGYVMTVPGRQATPIPFQVDEIIHFRVPGLQSIYYGTPWMFGAQYDVDLNKQIKTYGINFLLNNAQPNGVLSTDDSLTQAQWDRLMTTWMARHKGSGNAGKIAVLESGLKFEKTGSNLSEVAYPDTSRSVRDGILATFGVPASQLGLVEDVNRANADANEYNYQKGTIVPRLTLIEEKLNEKMMPLYDARLVCKFDSPVPEDKEFRLRERQINIASGYSTIDEEREKDGMEALNLPETSVPLIPFNLVPSGTTADDATAPKDEDPETKAIEQKKDRRDHAWDMFIQMTGPMEKRFGNAMKRFFKVQHDEITRNLMKHRSFVPGQKAGLETSLIFNVSSENKRLAGFAKPFIMDAFTGGLKLGAREVDSSIAFDMQIPNIERAIDERIQFFSTRINESTVELLNDTIQEGVSFGESIDKIAARVNGVFDFSEKYRSVRIAQTEVIGAANSGQMKAYHDAGVKEKEWITARDEKVRESHQIDGQVVGMTSGFTLNSGTRLQYPGDRSGDAPAEDIINCRCRIAPVVK
jgi:HK97 family phage portal protein